MEVIYATDIYEYLPHSNCKRCGEDNCMAFADKLARDEVNLTSCAPLRLKEQEGNRTEIEKMLKTK